MAMWISVGGSAPPDLKEVLEKIYFRNAMRIYPHVRENLEQLGYPVE